jgi:hypothetical protein
MTDDDPPVRDRDLPTFRDPPSRKAPVHDLPQPIVPPDDIAKLRATVRHWRSVMRDPGREPEYIEAMERLRELERAEVISQRKREMDGAWVPLSQITPGGLFRSVRGWPGSRMADEPGYGRLIRCQNHASGTECYCEPDHLCWPLPWPESHAPINDAFESLRAAGGDSWDKIVDPEEYLGRKDESHHE